MSQQKLPDANNGEDIDLEDAIGDVFDLFDFNPADNAKDHDKETERLPTEQQQQPQEEEQELDLDDAIGDVFNDVFGGETVKPAEEEKEEEPAKEDHLEDAIGEAFSGVFGEAKEEKETGKEEGEIPKDDTSQVESRQGYQEKDKEDAAVAEAPDHNDNKEQDDEDLDDLIGQAFDNIAGDPKENQKGAEKEKNEVSQLPPDMVTEEQKELPTKEPKEDDTTDSKEPEPEGTLLGEKPYESITEPKPADPASNDKEEPEKTGDDLEDLNDAIGQAFQSAISAGQEPDKTEEQQEKPTEAEATGIKETQDDPMDLDEAIGDAFKDLMDKEKRDEALKNQPTETEKPEVEKDSTRQTEVTAEATEVDLDEAIGDAFSNILGGEENDKPKESETDTAKEAPLPEKPDEDEAIDLDAAIGDAFSDILGSGKKESEVEKSKPTSKTAEPPADVDTMDLDQAIGAAFENLIDKDSQSTPEQQQQLPEKDALDEEIDLDAAIGDAFKHVLPQQSKDKSLPLPPDENDNALEDAIGEAFKSLAGSAKKDDELNDDDLNAMIAQSFQQALQAPKRKGQQAKDADMENAITQAFKSAMTDKSTPQLTSREIAIRNLAVEISHQVQDHLKDDKFNPPLPFIPGLPQLDAGVLAHFEKEAYTEDIKEANKHENLQSAITNAMKTADSQAGGIADLEQLEMNDILQNAFKMALEQPQELLSNLELDQAIQPPPISAPIPPRRPKFAPPKPSAGPSFKSYPRSTPVVAPPRPQPPKTTPTIPKRPVTKPTATVPTTTEAQRKPSLLSNPAVTSQLTTVISTLTSRINSGELSDANILQVIRQMTEELASGGSLTPFLKKSTAIEDVVASYRDEARQQMLKTLQISKIFLEKKLVESDKDENKKSVELVTTIINAFDPVGFAKSVVSEIKDDEYSAIFVFFNEVVKVFLDKCPTSRFSPTTVKNIKAIQEKIPKKDIARDQPEVEKISKDEKLTKPLNDLFNLLAGSSLLDNSQAMLVATAVALSVTGFVYRDSTKSDTDTVINAVCKIVNDILANTPGMTLKDGTPATSSSTSKRISDLILAGDLRRTKIDAEQIKIAVDGHARDTQANDSWNGQAVSTSSSIRMPQYRRPSAIDKNHIPHRPALTLPKHSPFISNKFASNTQQHQQQQPLQVSNSNGGGGGGGGVANRLKRPGSFQRPANSKAKTTSLGFPKLYSTSLKYN
ncbi:hypothetical protein Cantr_09128 [Candida viswanathii]|uniref:Uncharacterized protein n=1 Tax=Candida viswanathii TaxID=5486 RepID=A0A367YAZ1_9ASCO|nr:hypothetical protein Cantr_09128 [Candida viswanathii]